MASTLYKFCQHFLYRNNNIKLMRVMYASKYKQANHKLCGGISIYVKNIQTSTVYQKKNFIENENTYAHKILENNKSYLGTLVQQYMYEQGDQEIIPISQQTFETICNNNWSEKSSQQILKAFKSLTYYARDNNMDLADSNFHNIVNAMTQKAKTFTDQEISQILLYLALWPETKYVDSTNFYELWKTMDDVCVSRLKTWKIEELLLFADHWYKLNLTKATSFMDLCTRKIGSKPKKLTPSQLIQLMFYVNVMRKSLTTMYDFENRLSSCIDLLTLDEISILAMGFFKTKTQIRNPHLLAKIMNRISAEVTVHEISLCSLMKIIRYSMPLSHTQNLLILLNDLESQIPRLSLQTCVQIALAGTSTLTYHKSIIDAIALKIGSEIKNARLKDIERLTFAFTLYNYKDSEIYKLIEVELEKYEREWEIQKYPRAFASCVHYLTIQCVYNQRLISRVLDPTFITSAYGKGYYNIGREILSLDASVEAEVPEYIGYRLDPITRQKLTKKLTRAVPSRDRNPRINATDTILLEVLDTVEQIYGGPKFVKAFHILPHYERADILICLNETMVPQSIIWVDSRELGEVHKFWSGPKSVWIALVIGGWNSYIRNTDEPLGTVAMKIRQLTKLKYKPLLIPFHEWKNVAANQRAAYILDKVNSNFIKKTVDVVI